MVMQLVSVRDWKKTADVTGDPFDGRTLMVDLLAAADLQFRRAAEIRDRKPSST
jgi:hypothetical protein